MTHSTLINNVKHDVATLLTPCTVLTNPMDHLDELVMLAPASEYFAANAIAGSLGYSVLNQLLWSFRKLNAKAPAPDPTVDIFNNSYAEMFERRSSEEMSDDNGHTSLPNFEATKLVGVYMHMMYMQRANFQFADKYPARMPHEILHEMQNSDRSSETAAAYAALDATMINASPAAAAIKAEQDKNKKILLDYQVKQHKVEMDYILNQLKSEIPVRLTETEWQAIPLYIQYKWTVFVYKQVLKAIVQEQRSTDRSSDKFDRLLEMVNTIQLELESAAKTAEVKAAFESNKLDERHELVKKEATVETKPESKAVRVPAVH